MRVIAGEKRHLLLKTLPGLEIRPTTDIIKETLFNIIQFDLQGISFLDLFAGSGAIGIEALSRGAKEAYFIDNNSDAIKIINENLKNTGLINKAKVFCINATTAIEKLAKNNQKFDIIFMDPPYKKGLYLPVFEKIKDLDVLKTNAKIILETNKEDDAKDIINLGFILYKEKKYKSNKHIFFKR